MPVNIVPRAEKRTLIKYCAGSFGNVSSLVRPARDRAVETKENLEYSIAIEATHHRVSSRGCALDLRLIYPQVNSRVRV